MVTPSQGEKKKRGEEKVPKFLFHDIASRGKNI